MITPAASDLDALIINVTARVFTLTAGNDCDRWMSYAEAVSSGQAYVGRPHPWIVAADADDPSGDVDGFVAEVQGLGLQPVVRESGGEGRFHVFTVVGPVELRAQVTALAKSYGFDTRPTIRPLRSPHRLGLPTGITSHYSVEAVQAALGRPADFTPDGPTALPAPVPQVADHGRSTKYGRSAAARAFETVANTPSGARNNTLFTTAAALFELVAGEEVTDDEATAVLTDAAIASGLGPEETHKTIDSARARGTSQPRMQRSRVAVAHWLAGVHHALDEGRFTPSARRVVDALWTVADRAMTTKVSLSWRQLVEHSGVGMQAVQRAARDLEAAGWLLQGHDEKCSTWLLSHAEDVERSIQALASRDRIGTPSTTHPPCDPFLLVRSLSRSKSTAPSCDKDHDPALDVWRPVQAGGLGESARIVHGLLSADSELTIAELAEASGYCPQTVRRALSRLAPHGMAYRGAGGWSSGLRLAVEVNHELPSFGRGDRVRACHRRERAERALALARLRPAPLDIPVVNGRAMPGRLLMPRPGFRPGSARPTLPGSGRHRPTHLIPLPTRRTPTMVADLRFEQLPLPAEPILTARVAPRTPSPPRATVAWTDLMAVP